MDAFDVDTSTPGCLMEAFEKTKYEDLLAYIDEEVQYMYAPGILKWFYHMANGAGHFMEDSATQTNVYERIILWKLCDVIHDYELEKECPWLKPMSDLVEKERDWNIDMFKYVRRFLIHAKGRQFGLKLCEIMASPVLAEFVEPEIELAANILENIVTPDVIECAPISRYGTM